MTASKVCSVYVCVWGWRAGLNHVLGKHFAKERCLPPSPQPLVYETWAAGGVQWPLKCRTFSVLSLLSHSSFCLFHLLLCLLLPHCSHLQYFHLLPQFLKSSAAELSKEKNQPITFWKRTRTQTVETITLFKFQRLWPTFNIFKIKDSDSQAEWHSSNSSYSGGWGRRVACSQELEANLSSMWNPDSINEPNGCPSQFFKRPLNSDSSGQELVLNQKLLLEPKKNSAFKWMEGKYQHEGHFTKMHTS